jgi:DNA polymerase I-like protein with 3'-5' exonuclease and polymerase domains
MSKSYYIAKDLEQQRKIIKYFEPRIGVIAIDTETTSANAVQCKLIGISLSAVEGEAFYLPIDENDALRKDELVCNLDAWLQRGRTKFVMHNSVFDVVVLRQTLGLDFLPYLHADTILMKHTIDESRPHGLKECAIKYLGPEWGNEREDLKQSVLLNGGKWSKKEKNFDKADLDILGKYAAADADMTLRLYHLFEQKLIDQNLHKFFYTDEVMPLNSVVIKMFERGIKVDINYYENLKKELEKELNELEDKIHLELSTSYPDIYTKLECNLIEDKIPIKAKGSLFEQLFQDEGFPLVYNKKTGQPTFTQAVVEDALKDDPNNILLKWRLGKIDEKTFKTSYADKIYKARKTLFLEANDDRYIVNVGSNDQLGDLLFNHLGETVEKKTDGGKPQVDDEILESFSDKYSFIKTLLKFKRVRKLLTTYIEAVLNRHINSYIHPGWLQFGTESGRFSCVEPNYQNLPRDDARIKKGIIARDGYLLVGADYSQLEPRCFSHCSNEQKLIDSFKNGDDFYGTLAVDLFKLDCAPNEVKAKYPDIRFKVKVAGLAVAYGAKKWKLSSVLGVTVPAAENFRNNYFNTYTNLDKYIKFCQGTVLINGWISNQTGRIRHLPDVLKLKGHKDRKSVRELNGMLNLSVNFPIQSLAASIVNRSMIAMNKQFKKLNLDATILMQIHDEIVVEAKEQEAQLVSNIMKEIMENNYKLKLPLVAEPKIAKNLAETK